MRQEMASRPMMWRQRTSGSSGSTRPTSARCIAAIAKCLSLSWVVLGGLAAMAQQTAAPVASIESLVRSKDYDQALQLTKDQLQTKPNDIRMWTLEGIIFSLKDEKT